MTTMNTATMTTTNDSTHYEYVTRHYQHEDAHLRTIHNVPPPGGEGWVKIWTDIAMHSAFVVWRREIKD